MDNLHSILMELEKHVEPSGRVPEDLFFFISKYFGESCLELCVFRVTQDSTQVLLLPRPNNDPHWAGKLHIPGIRKIVTDDESSILNRVIEETELDLDPSDILYCNSRVIKNKRGTEFSDLRYVQYFGEQTENFYNVEMLPPNIIDFQIPLIMDSLKCLMERN